MENPLFQYIGEGEEAQVYRGELRVIRGIGGDIFFANPVTVAKRVNFPTTSGTGHEIFCKHLVFKILEYFFNKKKLYTTQHIPFPSGSYTRGYYYEFADGSEGFPSQIADENYNYNLVDLVEENQVRNSFNSFGIDIGKDTLDPNDSSRKNIIVGDYDFGELCNSGKLNAKWKRIDFGERSIGFDRGIFLAQAHKRADEMQGVIGFHNFKLMMLAYKYFSENGHLENNEKRTLERLSEKFRKRHFSNI